MDDLIGEFVADVRDSFALIQADLDCLDKNPNAREAVNAVFRFIHTVHGNCGFLRFDRFARISGPAERALANARERQGDLSSADIAPIITAIRHLGGLADAIDAGVAFPTLGEEKIIADLGGSIELIGLVQNPVVQQQEQAPANIRVSIAQLEILVEKLDAAEQACGLLLEDLDASREAHHVFDALRDAAQTARGILRPSLDKILATAATAASQVARNCDKLVHINYDAANLGIGAAQARVVGNVLMHLMRNAVDHGIESPDVRARVGKMPEGRINILAFQTRLFTKITIEDDGIGVDPSTIFSGGRQSADAKGLFDRLSEAGFTSLAEPTRYSGFGVGLDAVRSNVENLRGHVELESVPGKGTKVSLYIPHTLGDLADAA